MDIALFQNPPGSANGGGGGDGECGSTANAAVTEQSSAPTIADVKCADGEPQQGADSAQPKNEKQELTVTISSASEVTPKSSTPPKVVRNLQAFLTRPMVQLKIPIVDVNISMNSKQASIYALAIKSYDHDPGLSASTGTLIL